jgi:hypothetical protein
MCGVFTTGSPAQPGVPAQVVGEQEDDVERSFRRWWICGAADCRKEGEGTQDERRGSARHGRLRGQRGR